MILEELMRLAYNAGQETVATKRFAGWTDWWEEYGKERHDAFIDQELEEIVRVYFQKKEK